MYSSTTFLPATSPVLVTFTVMLFWPWAASATSEAVISSVKVV